MSDKRTVSTDALETLGTILSKEEFRDAIHLAVEPVEAGEYLNPGQHVFIDTKNGVTRAWRTEINCGVGIVDPFISRSLNPGERFWLVVYPRKITSLRHVWSHPDFAEPTKPLSALEEENERVRKIKAALYEANRQAIADTINTLNNLQFTFNEDPDLVYNPPIEFPSHTVSDTQVLIAAVHESDKVSKEKADKKAAAAAWIEKYANSLSGSDDDEGHYTITAEELIDTAQTHLNSNSRWGGDYIVKGGLLEGEYTSSEFWDQLAIYLDIEIPDDNRNNFFSCSC